MKSKSEILKEMKRALCPEAKYRMLRLEVEVDKRDVLFYMGKRICDIAEILNELKEEQS